MHNKGRFTDVAKFNLTVISYCTMLSDLRPIMVQQNRREPTVTLTQPRSSIDASSNFIFKKMLSHEDIPFSIYPVMACGDHRYNGQLPTKSSSYSDGHGLSTVRITWLVFHLKGSM